MDLEQLRELEIPQDEEVRNRILDDALKTSNPILIQFALAIGADWRIGGERLLAYAIQQGELQLLQKLVSRLADGLSIAIKLAIFYDQSEIANWLSKEGAVIHIDRECIENHSDTVRKLLNSNKQAKNQMQYEALEAAVCLKNGASEVLEELLDCLKRNGYEEFDKWLVNLADYTVDTERVDCMEIMRKYGLDLEYVNTKYHTQIMRKYLEENGIKVTIF